MVHFANKHSIDYFNLQIGKKIEIENNLESKSKK